MNKFYKLKRRNKPLYVEAYKIMAATSEVIKMKQAHADYSATSYFACLHEMVVQQLRQANGMSVEVLMYCYSAIVSMLPLGVIANQSENIRAVSSEFLHRQQSPMAMKYSIICLQFVMHSKSIA